MGKLNIFVSKVKKALLNPHLLVCFLFGRCCYFLPDKHYLFLMYLRAILRNGYFKSLLDNFVVM